MKSRENAGLNLPKPDSKFQEEQIEAMMGRDIKVIFKMDSQIKEMQFKESSEVGYLKLMLADSCSIPANKLELFFEGKQLLDPMSLCDHEGIHPPEAVIDVKIVSE